MLSKNKKNKRKSTNFLFVMSMFTVWNNCLTQTKHMAKKKSDLKKKEKVFYQISVYFESQSEVIFTRSQNYSRVVSKKTRVDIVRDGGRGILCFSEIQCRFHTHLYVLADVFVVKSIGQERGGEELSLCSERILREFPE